MKVYITSIKQISAQQPLTEEWFDSPVFYNEPYIKSIEANYKQYFTPNEARRFGKILKRALLVSREVMKDSGVANPDAIITGTGLGCIENTEIFLDKLVREGEELLNPTYFMQSTHNTISSLIAIDSKCHTYNTTYAHNGISFECALQDAFLQMMAGKIRTALLGAHDEMTADYFTLLRKAGYLGRPNQTFAGETAVAMMLSTEKTENTICEIEAIEKIYTGARHCGLDPQSPETDCHCGLDPQSPETDCHCGLDPQSPEIMDLLSKGNIDYIMIGTNGVEENDNVYFENCRKLFPNIPLLQYKNIFGESFTASALGFYAAAICLQRKAIPEHLFIGEKNVLPPRKILCYNHYENKNHTFILLSEKSTKS